MQITRDETESTVEIEVDDATFVLEAPKKTDFFFLAQGPTQEELAKFVLERKLMSIKGVTFEDGSAVTKAHVHHLPLDAMFELVNAYAEKITEFSTRLVEKKQNGTNG